MGHEGSPELSGAGEERKPASISWVVAVLRAQGHLALTEAAEQDLDEAVGGPCSAAWLPIPNAQPCPGSPRSEPACQHCQWALGWLEAQGSSVSHWGS